MWFIQIKMSYSEICTDRMGLLFLLFTMDLKKSYVTMHYLLFIIVRNASCSSQGRFLHTRI